MGWRWRAATGLVGVLFTRSLEQAERTYMAMLARGYDGTIRLTRTLHWRWADSGFVMAVAAYLVLLRVMMR